MSTKLGAKRGRPPGYDRARALAAITDSFWLNGFAATSLDDLSAAAGMARPSLYAAFGDKRAMYLASLAGVREMLANELAMLDSEPDLATALRRFYRRSLDVYLSGGANPRGCMAICTATTAANAHPDIRAALAAIIAIIDAAMIARFKRAQDVGHLPNDYDIEGASFLAAATLHSLAIRARAGATRDALEMSVDAAVAALANVGFRK